MDGAKLHAIAKAIVALVALVRYHAVHLSSHSCSDMTKYYAEAKCILDPPGQGGAILRTEFLEWAKVKRHTELCEKKTDFQSTDRRQHASDALVSPRRRGTAKNATGWLPTPKGYVLYHYDGQNSTRESLEQKLFLALYMRTR